jgi:hypothetical protein
MIKEAAGVRSKIFFLENRSIMTPAEREKNRAGSNCCAPTSPGGTANRSAHKPAMTGATFCSDTFSRMVTKVLLPVESEAIINQV